MEDYLVPRALDVSEIPGNIQEYAHGARLAKEAGFDGVEIHNANGYLLDQFLRDGTIHRQDAYGGSIPNRARLTLEVVEAVVGIWGADRVGIRFSPGGVFNDMHDSNPLAIFGYVLRELRPSYSGNIVTAGGFNQATGNQALAEGWADAIAFDVPFLANPDLPERFRRNAPLNEPDEPTFYAPGPKGYTDYPSLSGNA
jgi:N-ethylmaleimide reductase